MADLGTVLGMVAMVAIAIVASVVARFLMLIVFPDQFTESLRRIKRIERLERAREITPEQAHDEMVNEFGVYASREPKRSPRSPAGDHQDQRGALSRVDGDRIR